MSPAGPFRLVAQMIVKRRHVGFVVQPFSDATLVGDDETGDAVMVEQRQRFGRAWHPGKIRSLVRIAMVHIQRAVAVQKHCSYLAC